MHVVQIYASRAESAVERPVRWLVGFATVRAAAASSQNVSVDVPARALAHWDGTWQYEPGAFTFHIGASVNDESGQVTVSFS